MRVMICGGTGFIGTALSQALLDRGDEVIIVTRQLPAAPAAGFLYVTWQDWSADPNRFGVVDAIVSLAGETISKRWSEEAKRRILISRTQTALHLADIVRRMDAAPKVLVNASGISLYGHSYSPILKSRSKKKRPRSRAKSAAELLEQYRNDDGVSADIAGIRGFSAGSQGPTAAEEAANDAAEWGAPAGAISGRNSLGSSSGDTAFDYAEPDAFIGMEDDASSDMNELLGRMAAADEAADGAAAQAGITSSLDYGWFDEDSPARPEDFLGQVVVAWEEAADQVPADRIVKLRISLVLGREGGTFPLLRLPYKFFAGGRMGSGTQGFPWIHLHDLVGLILFSLDHPHVSGAINAVAPDPVNNDQFGRTLGKVMGRGHWLHVPEWLLKRVLGEQSVLLLTGQHAYPRRALELGFSFAYPKLEDALRELTD